MLAIGLLWIAINSIPGILASRWRGGPGAKLVYTPSPTGLRKVLKEPGGTVYLWLFRSGEKIELRAKDYLSGKLANVRTGNLRDSIEFAVVPGGVELVLQVEARATYAMAVHEGGRAHDIVPSSSGIKVLRFPGRGGGTIYRPKTHMKRQKRRPFLSRAMIDVLGRL